jgi:hypothetical protein
MDNVNPLAGNARKSLFDAALAFAGNGSRIVDPGCPLTLFGRVVEVGVARGHGLAARVRLVSVNVDTLACEAV